MATPSLALGLALGLACTSSSPPEPSPAEPSPAMEDVPAMAAVEPASTAPPSTEPDALQGFFDIDRISGGKRFQGSWLELPDGERLVLSYRPLRDYLAYVEKQVVVTGERYQPEGQAISGPHFRVESMRLAEGETARATVPTSLPVPPLCRDQAAVLDRLDRWAQVVGTLVDAHEIGSRGWYEVVLRLDDGTELRLTEFGTMVDHLYRPRFGTRVTITGQLSRADDSGGLRLGGATALCEGEVDGCGMTTASVRR